MARLNTASHQRGVHGTTHEGAPAAPMTPEQALRRSVMSCLLWENEFYEDGQEIAARIAELAGKVNGHKLGELAIEARTKGNLRHVPLLLLSLLATKWSGQKRKNEASYVKSAIENVIQRADELTEFLAIHAKLNGVQPNAVRRKISAQMKRGMAAAFTKFDEYQLAKYDRAGAVRLRDALFLCHAKPKDEAQAALWKRLVAGELKTPDTWEVNLSGGADKRATFERLLREHKLGYLALLRNLRNMEQAGVDSTLVREAIVARKGAWRVLPFRYVAAARAAPQFEPALDEALCTTIEEMPRLPGKTLVLADVSGSMDAKLSGKSDMRRIDAACVLASILHGDIRMFSFSDGLVEVPPRRGMAGVDALSRSQNHNGTRLIEAVQAAQNLPHDRIIVITDEQAHAVTGAMYGRRLPDPRGPGYMINVASNKRGIGYGKWTHIDGFSENVLRFIYETENVKGATLHDVDPWTREFTDDE